METKAIIQSLEKEIDQNTHTSSSINSTQNFIEKIKKLFRKKYKISGIFFYYLLIGGITFGIMTILYFLIEVTDLFGTNSGLEIFLWHISILFYVFYLILPLLFNVNIMRRENRKSIYTQLNRDLESIQEKESVLYEHYNVLLIRVLNDIKSENIDINQISDIKNIISFLTKIYKETKKEYKILENGEYRSIFSCSEEEVENIFNAFKNEKLLELRTIGESIIEKIQIWMQIHQSELQELEKDIAAQKNESQNPDGKVALDLQSKRLQSYIDSIKKLTQ